MNYIRNDIVNTLKVKIICYSGSVRDMHDLAKYLPPSSMKGYNDEASNFNARNQEFTAS